MKKRVTCSSYGSFSFKPEHFDLVDCKIKPLALSTSMNQVGVNSLVATKYLNKVLVSGVMSISDQFSDKFSSFDAVLKGYSTLAMITKTLGFCIVVQQPNYNTRLKTHFPKHFLNQHP